MTPEWLKSNGLRRGGTPLPYPDCVALMEQADSVPAALQMMEKADGRSVPCGASRRQNPVDDYGDDYG
jgi:hypothetical protein